MKQKSIKKNFIYNLILTSLNLIFPLITAPYVSKILGASNIGKVNYATALINWFILFAAFGVPRFGIREVAMNRDNKRQLSTVFWNLIIVQLIFSMISIAIYLALIFTISSFSDDIYLYLVMIFMIILNIFSIDWFYQGIEEYGYITLRNIIFKIISLVMIFTMIKNRNDYIFYALVNVFGLSFNNILNYIHAKKYIDKDIYGISIFKYIKKLKVFFYTTLVISIYTTLDQTLIGIFSKKQDLAFYVRSNTAIGIGVNITNSIITVITPRASYLVEKNHRSYKELMSNSLNYIYLLAFPCVVGLGLLSKDIMLLLGGEEFIPASYSLKIDCVLVLITSMGTWQIQQILIPNRYENLAFKIQCMAAVLSIVLNFIFIPKFSYIAAASSWVIVEVFLVVFEGIIINRKYKIINIKYITKSAIKYFVAALIMGLFVIAIKLKIKYYITVLLVSLMISPVIYFTVILIEKDQIVLNLVRQVIAKMKRN
jgi:O-antigen/teichoic acid export membrane protein